MKSSRWMKMNEIKKWNRIKDQGEWERLKYNNNKKEYCKEGE